MNGIDVSYAQGWFDWAGAAAEGVEFAIVKASQGRLINNPDSGAFADPRFLENVLGAHAAGIPIGVYHYLTAGTVAEAVAEADFFTSLIAPYRDKIALWAVCDAEEEKYLPRDREQCGRVVRAFLERVRGAGFRHPPAGVCFAVASMSLVGVPVLGGFISKLYLSDAALTRGGWQLWIMLGALALSTLLNVLYLVKTFITLYRPPREGFHAPQYSSGRLSTLAMWGCVAANVLVGLMANPIAEAIRSGLAMFD